MAKPGAFSVFAETVEEFIQLECVRRRNQSSLKRRSSLLSQFHVSSHKSRLKEKLAQEQHHVFLLLADNKAALVSIIETVRELANDSENGGEGSQTSQHNNGPSLLERDRFMVWAASMEKLLYEFNPSESHENDPMLRLLERFQFLQDGHICLAQVAMDARSLLERWDRSGVFDSESSSEDSSDDENDTFPADTIDFLASHSAREINRHFEQSYAYQTVRQRAAASIIKRNVLTWVCSKASFCERVAEIQVFGRTTEALLKGLSLTSAVLSRVSGNADTDFFALATGRYDPKSRYSSAIAFQDLLQYSKHMALYPVDQALRTVEDVTRRRYLFDSRCAVKIQVVWRQVRETVRARRLNRVLEELRLQREQEAQARREAAKELKKRKASEVGKRKPSKRSSTTRSSVIASSISRLSTMAALVNDELKAQLTPAVSREATAVLSSSIHVDVSDRIHVDISDDGSKHPISPPNSSQKASRGHATHNNDSDDDTTDVEAAWQSFMDTVATDMAIQEPVNEAKMNSELEEKDPISLMPPVTLPPMDDTWESWSDEENEVGNNEADTNCPLTAAKPRTPSTSTAPTPRIKVVVSINKSDVLDPAARRARRKDMSTPRQHQAQVSGSSKTAIRPPSSLPFDATLQNHTGPYTGAGQLSLMAPFVDSDRSKKATVSVVPERKHLYELDFTSVQRNDAAGFHIATALTDYQVDTQLSQPKPLEKVDLAHKSIVNTPHKSSRRATVARLRSVTSEQEQSVRIYEAIDPENRETNDQQDTFTAPGDTNSNKAGYFTYKHRAANIERELVQRKGTMVDSPVTNPPDKETLYSAESGVKEMKTWHRSTIAVIPQAPATPHPPTDRFRPRHKKRKMGLQRQTISAASMDEIVVTQTPTGKSFKRVDKSNELPLLLRRSRAAAHCREADRMNVLPDDEEDDHFDSLAPDATKQTWKRSGELPLLALAHIRDRVGCKKENLYQRRMSIIAGRAPPITGAQSEEKTTVSIVDQLETILPLENEFEDSEEETTTEDEANHHLEEFDTNEGDFNLRSHQNSDDGEQSKQNDELKKEFERLHLASLERGFNCQRSVLSHLQNEEDIAVNNPQQRSKDDSNCCPDHEPDWQNKRQDPGVKADEMINSTDIYDAGTATMPVHAFSDEDMNFNSRKHRRNQLHVKTRDPINYSIEADDDEEEEESNDMEIGGMTRQERDAAFQKLLTQYLGLLQCTPAEVAKRLQVNI